MNNKAQSNAPIQNACLKSCQKILAQMTKTKDAVLTQFRDALADHEQLLRLALNEAEALAWETHYPQLVFPDLAEEKAQRVANWAAHQRLIRPDARFEA